MRFAATASSCVPRASRSPTRTWATPSSATRSPACRVVSLESYLQRDVFEPLGMLHSAIEIPAALANRTAVRYARDGAALPHYDPDTDRAPARSTHRPRISSEFRLPAREIAGARSARHPPRRDYQSHAASCAAESVSASAGSCSRARAPASPSTAVAWTACRRRSSSCPSKRLVVGGPEPRRSSTCRGASRAEIVNRLTGRDIDLNRDRTVAAADARNACPPRSPASGPARSLGAQRSRTRLRFQSTASGAIQARLDAGERRPVEGVEVSRVCGNASEPAE